MNRGALSGVVAQPTPRTLSETLTASGGSTTGLSSRLVGATVSGAPTSGTYALGDFVIAQNGHVLICTAAGSPGTWVDVMAADAVTSVAGRTGAVTLTAADVAAGTFPAGTFNFSGTLQEGGNRVYSAGNAPPYPVTSVAGRTGAVTLTAADVGAGTFSGSFVFGSVLQVGASGSNGYVQLSPGDASHTGYFDFFSPAGNRQGYIGWSTTNTTGDTGTLNYVAGEHDFTGILSLLSVVAHPIAGSIELGQQGTANTPYIDFHAGATNVDYDGRIQCTAGTGTIGAGTMAYTAGTHAFTGAVTTSGAGSLRRGGGTAAGTNYANGHHSINWTQANATWSSLQWNTKDTSVEDDGTIWTTSTTAWTCTVFGMWTHSIDVVYATSSSTGLRGCRVITQGGTALGVRVANAADTNIPSTSTTVAYGPSLWLASQTWQSSGAGLTANAGSGSHQNLVC